jgi:hypothetical protein
MNITIDFKADKKPASSRISKYINSGAERILSLSDALGGVIIPSTFKMRVIPVVYNTQYHYLHHHV